MVKIISNKCLRQTLVQVFYRNVKVTKSIPRFSWKSLQFRVNEV